MAGDEGVDLAIELSESSKMVRYTDLSHATRPKLDFAHHGYKPGIMDKLPNVDRQTIIAVAIEMFLKVNPTHAF